MTQRRFYGRPVVWLIFGVLVAVPSAQLTRLLRAQRGSRVELAPPAPVTPAASPRPISTDSASTAPLDSSDDTPGPFRYEPVGPARAPIAAAAVSRTGRLVAVLDDSGEVRVWDVRARRRIATIASQQRLPMRSFPHGAPIAIEEIIVGMPGSAFLAVGGNDGRFRVWSVRDGKNLLTAPHSAKDAATASSRGVSVVDAEISSMGGLTSVSGNGSLALWSCCGTPGSSPIWMTRSPGGDIYDLDINLDDEAIVVAADEAVYLLMPRDRSWSALDTRSAQWQAGDKQSRGSPQEVRFSPGGGIVAAAWSNGDIRVYSVASRERLHTMHFGREGWRPRFLAFSPDGKLLAATDGHRVIQVWPMKRFGAPVALTAPRGSVRSMWFTPDGKNLVVSTHGDRYLRSLPVPPTQ